MKILIYAVMFLEIAVISGSVFLVATAIRADRRFSETLHYFYPALAESGPALFISTMLGRTVSFRMAGEVEAVDAEGGSLRLKVVRSLLSPGSNHDVLDFSISTDNDTLFKKTVFIVENGVIIGYRDEPAKSITAAATELQPGDLVVVNGVRQREDESLFRYAADLIAKTVFEPAQR